MKVFVVFAILVASVHSFKVPDKEKIVPGFASNFVIKGHEADPHSAPFIVSLSTNATKHSHFCGGTIIDKEWVVTAGHCVPKKGPEGLSVLAGLHNRRNIDNKTQSSIVDWGVVHEKYENGVGPYDIAILHLAKPFKVNKYVKPAILPANEEIHTGETQMYGWGQPKFYAFNGAKTLQTVTTEIVPIEKCKAVLPETAPLHETNICTDSLQKGVSACNGDSGGPLIINGESLEPELIGVSSWVYVPCGIQNLPSIYTRVSAHKPWIYQKQNQYYAQQK